MDSDRMQSIREQMQKFKELSPFSSIIDGMTQSEYAMLKMIERRMQSCHEGTEQAGIKTTALSELLCISKPAVSQMLNVLEGKGLIERVMTPHDRRVVYVVLTTRGQEKFAAVRKQFDAFVEEIFQRMGKEDTDEFLRLLAKLHAVIGTIKKAQ